MLVLVGSRVRVPRCSGTNGASKGRKPVYIEKYKLRSEFPGRWFLPHGVTYRSSVVERSWSLQQLLVAGSVVDGHSDMTGFHAGCVCVVLCWLELGLAKSGHSK